MLEKLNFEYSAYLEGFRNASITVKDGVLYYEYNEMLVPETVKGTLKDYSAFEKALEDLKIYSFRNNYSYNEENNVLMDGFYYSVDYKEAEKKRTKKIKGDNYYGDELYSLFTVIEQYIPQLTLIGKVDEKEELELFEKYLQEYRFTVNYDLNHFKQELARAKTHAEKKRIIKLIYDDCEKHRIRE